MDTHTTDDFSDVLFKKTMPDSDYRFDILADGQVELTISVPKNLSVEKKPTAVPVKKKKEDAEIYKLK